MNSNFYNILQYSKDTKSIIAIFQDPSAHDFLAGYVLDFNEEFFTLQHISKFGKLDGILIEPIYKIRRIDQDDYCKCLQYVMKHAEELDRETMINLDIPGEENWMYHTLKALEGETECTFAPKTKQNESNYETNDFNDASPLHHSHASQCPQQ